MQKILNRETKEVKLKTLMKHPFCLVFTPILLFCSTLTVHAAPAIKEIRLSDSWWGEFAPWTINSFVFRANGDFYWLEGKSDNVVRHHFSISPRDFNRLAAAVQKGGFFELKNLYDGHYSVHGKTVTVTRSTHGPNVTLQVVRGGQTKTVDNHLDAGPSALWELEMIMRGYAARRINSQKASIPKWVPPPTALPAPTPAPIAIIRGARSGRK